MKTSYLWILLLCAPALVVGKIGTHCKSVSDCKGPHEDCMGGICQCEAGALSWDGDDCITKRNYGETCEDPNQCLMSQDPHMDCLEINTEGNKVCMCGNKMHYNFGTKKCEALNVKLMNPATKVEINLANPTQEEIDQFHGVGNFREFLETKGMDPNKPKMVPKKGNFADPNLYFGPLVVALMALIVISICCCFWRIDPRAPHEIDIERERAKAVERALAELQLDGHSNFGFQGDDWNCDTVSRHTAATDVGDEKDVTDFKLEDKNEESGGVKVKAKTKTKSKSKTVEKAKASDQTEKEFSINELKSEPETKEKTIPTASSNGEERDLSKLDLKSREIETWLKGRMEQIEEGRESVMSGEYIANRQDLFGNNPEAIERRIELVETDDCTSIDTAIPDLSDGIIMNPADLNLTQRHSLLSNVTLQPQAEQKPKEEPIQSPQEQQHSIKIEEQK